MPERTDTRFLYQPERLDVVDVSVGVEIAPSQRDGDVEAGHMLSLE